VLYKKEILRLNLENLDLSMFLQDNFVLEHGFKANNNFKDAPKLQVSKSIEDNPSKGVDCAIEVADSDSENENSSWTDEKSLIGSPSEDKKSVIDVDGSDEDYSLERSNDDSDYECYDSSPIYRSQKMNAFS